METFFRYTISNVDKLTTLAEEIANVENYCTIQRFRFGEKIAFRVENLVGEELDVYKAKIPKLTLQPIVENAVFTAWNQNWAAVLSASSCRPRLNGC